MTGVPTVFALVVRLVLELEKGSKMTKHRSPHRHRQSKLVKCRLEYQVKFERKYRES